MNRHVLMGRFGTQDTALIASATDEVVTQLQFVKARRRFDHGIGDALDALRALDLFPSETAVDLLLVAAHIHAADTRISRVTESQDAWTREIRLVIPVASPLLWEQASPILSQMLNFLTGDRWVFQFRSRPTGFEATVASKPLTHAAAAFDGVSLFSGGLDSMIGAIDALQDGLNPLFVSHAGEGAVSASQEKVFQYLESKFPNRTFRRLRIWMNFDHGIVANSGPEDSTRGRSFLFFATAAFAASGFDQGCCIRVPENGLIALNVPLDPLRLGSLSTRTTHPFYIARWNDLLQALHMDTRIENPYWDRTKGEMVEGCHNQAVLQQLVAASLSCSSPTKARWVGRPTEHCGFCLPCLIRRASLKKGLESTDPTTYTLADLKAAPLKTSKAEGVQVRSFQMAIRRLKARPQLADILIHKPGPLMQESEDRQKRLGQVYLRGMLEVGALLDGVVTEP